MEIFKKIAKEIKRATRRVKAETKRGTNSLKKEITKTSGRVEKELERSAKSLGKEFDRAKIKVDNLSQEWNEWRENKLDDIGEYISLFFNSLKYGILKGFPNGFGVNSYQKIDNPDVDIFIRLEALNRGLLVYLKNAIPFEKNAPNSNNFIHPKNAKLEVDPARNIIILKASGGMFGFEAVNIRGGLRINGVTLEIAPKITQKGSKIILDIYGKMVYVDLNDSPKFFDAAVAHGINEFFEDKGVLASEDITDMVKFTIPIVNKKESLEATLSKASIFTENKGIRMQMKYKLTEK